MCYTSCYIFSLDKQEDQAWVFSAQCATQSNDFTRIEIDNCCVEDSDIKALFEILKKKNDKGKTLLEFVRDYKSCKKCKFIKIYDETTYCYSFSYSDSTYDSASVEPDKEIIQFYKNRLISYGVMKSLKNNCRTSNKFTKTNRKAN